MNQQAKDMFARESQKTDDKARETVVNNTEIIMKKFKHMVSMHTSFLYKID